MEKLNDKLNDKPNDKFRAKYQADRLSFLAACIGIVALAAATWLSWQARRLPSLAHVERQFQTQDRVLVDRKGRVVENLSVGSVHRLQWLALEEVSAKFRKGFSSRLSLHQVTNWVLGQPRAGFWNQVRHQINGLLLMAMWTPEQRLEAALNLAPFGANLQGLAAASWELLDKAPSSLNWADTQLLLPAIGRHSPVVTRPQTQANQAHLASSLVEVLLAHPELQNRPVIQTTLDREMQMRALELLNEYIAFNNPRPLAHGAIVVIENETGQVLVYAGSEHLVGEAKTHAISASRPVGHALQPLLVAKALDEKVLTPASTSKALQGHSLREALALKLDGLSVHAFDLIGSQRLQTTMAELGFQNASDDDFFGPSYVVDSAKGSLVNLTNAFRTLANDGMWSPLRLSPQLLTEKPRKRVFSREAAFVLSHLLRGQEEQRFVRVESEIAQDSWTIGFSSHFTVGVWIGHLGRDENWRMSTAHGSTPIWEALMKLVHRERAAEEFVAPEGLARIPVLTREEFFMPGTKPTPIGEAILESAFIFPKDRAIVPLPFDQKSALTIQIRSPQADQSVYVNGDRLGPAQDFMPWVPWPGRYNLELRDSGGQTLDKVAFEVRGSDLAGER